MSIQISGDQIKNSAVTAGKLDLSTGTFDFSSAVLQAGSPLSDSDVAIKSYVDSIASSSVFWKEAVKCATTAQINLASDLENGDSIDGITLVTGDRVLVKDQTDDATQNGIYIVAASGAASRAPDMNSSDEFSGSAVFVQQGTVNADQGYICTNNGSVVVGTTAIDFTQFTGLGQITAGAALTKTNNTLNVAVDDSSIEISADALQVKSSGITNDMLAGSITNAKLQNSTISGVALGSNLQSLSAQSNGGVTFTSFNGSAAVSDLKLDISNLQPAAVDVAFDSIAIFDSSATSTGKETIADLMTAVAGDGIGAASGVLSVNVDNSSIEVNGDSLRVKASGVTNAMLQNSTISGKALGTSLGALSKATNAGLTLTSYDGSASVGDLALDLNDLSAAVVNVAQDYIAIYDASESVTGKESIADLVGFMTGEGLSAASGVMSVVVDDNSIEISGGSLQVKASGITNNMLFGSISTSKLSLETKISTLSPDGSTAAFDLDHTLTDNTSTVLCFRNGICIEQVDSNPSGVDQFTISINGGTAGVGLITFGGNVSSSDSVKVFYLI